MIRAIGGVGTQLTSSTVSGIQIRYSLIRTMTLLVICARFPGRLSSRSSVDRAPAAAAAAAKAVADDALSVGLFSFRSSVDRTGETRTEWWLVDGLTGPRKVGKKKKKKQKQQKQ